MGGCQCKLFQILTIIRIASQKSEYTSSISARNIPKTASETHPRDENSIQSQVLTLTCSPDLWLLLLDEIFDKQQSPAYQSEVKSKLFPATEC